MSSERWSTRGERVARVPLRSRTIRVPGARESVRRKCGSHYCCSSLCSGQVREHSTFPPFSRSLHSILDISFDFWTWSSFLDYISGWNLIGLYYLDRNPILRNRTMFYIFVKGKLSLNFVIKYDNFYKKNLYILFIHILHIWE